MLRRRAFRTQVAPLVALVLGVAICGVNVRTQTAGPPYTKEAIVEMLKSYVPPHHLAVLARQRGINFQITAQVESELRRAGATAELLTTLREIAPKPPEKPAKTVVVPPEKPAEIVVQTSPGAEVYVDDQYGGRASPEGRLVVRIPNPGDHTLRVSLTGKRDSEQTVRVAAGQTTEITAALVDLAGTLVVQTSPGAVVILDGMNRGTADSSGKLSVREVNAGPHELRITAAGKREYRQNITVAAGQEASVEARLEDVGPSPRTVRDNPKDGLKYVWLPPGTFMMGCSPGDNECFPEEKPSHQVTISKGFWMGQTVVTVGAYKRFAAATGKQMPPEPNFDGRMLNPSWGDDAMPIVDVTWDEAQAYCGWAGGRLPTEAEWEYAARAGSIAARYGDLDEIAWYADNSGGQRLDSTRIAKEDGTNYIKRLTENGNGLHDVAQKRANSFGLYDILGNVWEWVNDWYDQNYYQNSPSQDPTGPASGQFRVLRGGSWYDGSGSVRVSFRFRYIPGDWYNFLGFRCGGEVSVPRPYSLFPFPYTGGYRGR